MKNLKHLFTALLLLCVTVATAHDFEVGGIYYNITSTTDFTVEVTYRGSYCDSYKNEYSGNVVIPESVIYNGSTYSVTSIGEDAFLECSGLTSVVIGNSVTSIGSYAFLECSGLTSVVIGNSVTSIGGCAFYNCSGLTSVVIPNSVTSIGSYAFDGTAWYNNQPDGVVYAGKVLYKYKGTMSSNTSIAIKDGTLGIGYGAFDGCSGLTSVEIPNSVTSIGSSAFYNCSGLTSVEIPNSVTSIGSSAFYNCSGLTSVEIPNSVTSIGEHVFEGCSGLKEVHISDLSAWCGISFGSYSANPLYYAHNLYLNGELVTDLVIPDGVTEIKGYAFSFCSGLTSVVIPNSVTSIGEDAFYNCSALKKVINFSSLTFSKGSTANGYVAYNADTVINVPNGFVEGDFVFAVIDGVNTLCGYIGAGGDVTLPADYKGENYAIGADVFKNNTSLTSVEIPNSVTSIGSYAFYNCSGLKEVHISDLSAWCGIEFGGDCANPLYFAHNLYLNGELVTDLVIPDGVIEIKRCAFNGCSGLTSVVIPNSVTSIGEYAFYKCSGLTSVVIGNSVTSIGEYAFYNCSGLTSVVIGNSVTSIGERAFYNCSGLKKVINCSLLKFSKGSTANGYVAYYADTVINVPNGFVEGDFVFAVIDGVNTLCLYVGAGGDVTLPADYKGENYVIGSNVFYNCSGLTSVVIPNSVTSIGEHAFDGCSGLTSVEIPNSVTSIGWGAFYNCSGLTSVVIPNSVTSIGLYAFYNCSGLKEVHISDLSAWCGIEFGGKYANPLCYADNLYLNGELVTDLEIPDGVIEIKRYAFNGCSGLTSVVIPNSVTSVGSNAFDGCSGLTSVVIGNSVTSIGEYAFYNCSGLTSVVIGNSVTSIGCGAFYNCSGLTSVEIPNSVTSIEWGAFYNCSGLTSIEILDGVTGIGEAAFRGCSDLEYIYISSTIESIGDYAFAECNNIFDIKIGSKKAVAASENVFSSDAYNNACLYVPAGHKDFYAKTSPWSNFIIQETDFTGIDEVKGENGKVEGVCYDLNGRAVERPANGLYIKNGKKVFVK